MESTGINVQTPTDEDRIEAAFRALRAGGIVLHPTATVYGFGTLLQGPGLEALMTAKERGAKGFVVLLPESWVSERLLGPAGLLIAQRFWPGPLTLIVADLDGRFSKEAKAPDGSVAVRVPGHPMTRALLRRLGEPITSTSANRPGEPGAYDVVQGRRVSSDLGLSVVSLDGGILPGGPPSTLLDVRAAKARVVREGAVSTQEIGKFLESSQERW